MIRIGLSEDERMIMKSRNPVRYCSSGIAKKIIYLFRTIRYDTFYVSEPDAFPDIKFLPYFFSESSLSSFTLKKFKIPDRFDYTLNHNCP